MQGTIHIPWKLGMPCQVMSRSILRHACTHREAGAISVTVAIEAYTTPEMLNSSLQQRSVAFYPQGHRSASLSADRWQECWYGTRDRECSDIMEWRADLGPTRVTSKKWTSRRIPRTQQGYGSHSRFSKAHLPFCHRDLIATLHVARVPGTYSKQQ